MKGKPAAIDTRSELIHQLIIRRAEQEKRRSDEKTDVLLQQGTGSKTAENHDDGLLEIQEQSDSPGKINGIADGTDTLQPFLKDDGDRDEESVMIVADDAIEVESKLVATSSDFDDAYERYLDSIINKGTLQSTEVYDPYEHRIHYELTLCDTIMHLVRSMLGIGILKLPLVYKDAGIFNGVAITTAFVLLSSFTMHVMIHTRNRICIQHKVPWLSIGDTVREAVNFGPWWLKAYSNNIARIVEASVIIKQIFVNVVIVRFLSQMVSSTYSKLYGPRVPPEDIIKFSFVLPIFYMTMKRRLKTLVFLSYLGNILLFIAASLITYHLTDGKLADASQRKGNNSFLSITEFLVLGIFSLDSLEMGIAVEKHMKYPKSFLGLLGVYNIALAISTLVLTLFGLFPSWKFGQEIKPFLFDHFSLGPELLIAITVSFILMSSTTFALHIYLPVRIFWTSYFENKIIQSPNKKSWEHFVRLNFVMVIFIFSLLPQSFRVLTKVIGIALMPLVSITLPMALHLCYIMENDTRLTKYYKARNSIIIIISLVATLFCVIQMLYGNLEIT